MTSVEPPSTPAVATTVVPPPEDREFRLAFSKLHVLRITPAGQKLLKQFRSEVEELYRELVLAKEPEHSKT